MSGLCSRPSALTSPFNLPRFSPGLSVPSSSSFPILTHFQGEREGGGARQLGPGLNPGSDTSWLQNGVITALVSKGCGQGLGRDSKPFTRPCTH